MQKAKNRAINRAGQGYQRASSVPQENAMQKSTIIKNTIHKQGGLNNA